MRFKKFMELYGSPAAMGGENVIQKSMRKQVKGPFGKGQTVKRKLNTGPSMANPVARPVGITAPNKPMTIKSAIK